MLSTLRRRLWFSYTILIGVMMCSVASGLYLSLRQNPVLYRQVTLNLRIIEIEITPLVRNALVGGRLEQIPALLQQEAETREVRILLIRADGSIVFDSLQAETGLLPSSVLLPGKDDQSAARDGSVKDKKGITWLYVSRSIGKGFTLAVATPRPRLPLRTVLRDNLVSPLIWSGIIALGIAFILAILLANGISKPLQQMAEVSRMLADGDYTAIPVKGPKEIKQLAKALNDMSKKVNLSQQSQREFIANVSHELKTPLTAIQGFAQAILDGAVQTPENLRQAATVIYTETSRMHRLVTDLLSLARLEAGTADLQRTPVDINLIAQTIVERSMLQATQMGIKLHTRLAEVPTMIGDGDRLAQVISNLVDNALKFTPQGGKVVVETGMQAGWIEIRVIDTGQGVQPEDRSKIFERFYQVEKSRKGGAGHGVGLGLPIAKQIVQAHGGRIWVESNLGNPSISDGSISGKGSIFIVQLPPARPDDITVNRHLVAG